MAREGARLEYCQRSRGGRALLVAQMILMLGTSDWFYTKVFEPLWFYTVISEYEYCLDCHKLIPKLLGLVLSQFFNKHGHHFRMFQNCNKILKNCTITPKYGNYSAKCHLISMCTIQSSLNTLCVHLNTISIQGCLHTFSTFLA